MATYGQLARMLMEPRSARAVGWAMRVVKDEDDVPWHRVVNAQGRISLRPGAGADLQRALLEDEGVEFDPSDTIDLERFGWDGPGNEMSR